MNNTGDDASLDTSGVGGDIMGGGVGFSSGNSYKNAFSWSGMKHSHLEKNSDKYVVGGG